MRFNLHGEPNIYSDQCSFDVTVGIVPIFCETLFSEVEAKRKDGSETEYQVFPVISYSRQVLYVMT